MTLGAYQTAVKLVNNAIFVPTFDRSIKELHKWIMRNYIQFVGVVHLVNGNYANVMVFPDMESYQAFLSLQPTSSDYVPTLCWLELNKSIVMEVLPFAFNCGWPQWQAEHTQIPYNPHIKITTPRFLGWNSKTEKR